MVNSLKNLLPAVKGYLKRVFGYDAETRAAFICVAAALVNAVLCAVSVFAVAIYLLCRKKGSVFLKKGNRSGFVFGVLSLAVSAFYLNYFGIIASFYFLSALLIMLCFREKINKEKLNDIFTLIIAYSVIAFAVAVIQRIFHLSAIEDRSASTFLNALYYCFYISFVIMLCLYRVIYENRSKLIYFSLIFINLIAILLTGSKMPWLGVAAAVFVMLIFSKHFKAVIIFTALGIAGIVCLWLLRDYGITEKLHMNGFLESFTMRFPYWNRAVNGFMQKPVFGHGMLGFLKQSVDSAADLTGFKFNFTNLETFLDNLKHTGWHLHAHNIAFDCLYNYGVVGSTILLFAIVKRCRELYIKSGKNIFDPMVTLVMSSLIFILVDGIVDCQIVGVQTLFISVFLFSATGIYKDKNLTDRSF